MLGNLDEVCVSDDRYLRDKVPFITQACLIKLDAFALRRKDDSAVFLFHFFLRFPGWM